MKSYLWLNILSAIFAIGRGSVIQNSYELREKNEESPRLGVVDSFSMLWCYFQNGEVKFECLPYEMQLVLKLTGKVPETRNAVDTQFRLFTRKQNKDPEQISNLKIDAWDIKKSNFNPSLKTKFITHGYFGADAEWAVEMKDAFLEKEDCNVVIVDWDGGDGPLYPQAYANVPVVGFEIATFVQYLKNNTKLRVQDVHLIGHSLGAHASGFGGKIVQELTKEKVGRITGLDPAGPNFHDLTATERLDASDALFVDVIHTDMGDSFTNGFGIPKAIGHFDFYPNGGASQPECEATLAATEALEENGLVYALSFLSPLVKVGELVAEEAAEVMGSVCSHGQSHEYFTASIRNSDCRFASLECSSWEDYTSGKCGSCADHECIPMGYDAGKYQSRVQNQTNRKFYLKTTAQDCTEKP